MRFLSAFLMTMLVAFPLQAAVYPIDYSGNVTLIEGNASGSEIGHNDQISWKSVFDESQLSNPVMLEIGGGTYTIYNVILSNFSLRIGSFEFLGSPVSANLTFMDNSWGMDGIVLSVGGLPGGPFGSSFSNVQFQGRGSVNSIDNSGIGNGLPLSRFDTSFFAIFGDSNTSKRVFGNLTPVKSSAVPEPSSWIMLIVGLLVSGHQLRRKYKRGRARSAA